MEEARNILIKYHSPNDPDSRLVDFEMAEIVATLEAEKIQKSGRWTEWVKTPGNRWRLLIVSFVPTIVQLSGAQIISYYLHLMLDGIGITNAKTQLIINATIQVDQLVFSVIVSLLVERFERRKLHFASIIGMICSLSICSGLGIRAEATNFSNIGLSNGVLAFICISKSFTTFQPQFFPPMLLRSSHMLFEAKE